MYREDVEARKYVQIFDNKEYGELNKLCEQPAFSLLFLIYPPLKIAVGLVFVTPNLK